MCLSGHHQMLLPQGVFSSKQVWTGLQCWLPDVSSGAVGPRFDVQGEWCTLPCDLSHDAFAVTYPPPADRQVLWKHYIRLRTITIVILPSPAVVSVVARAVGCVAMPGGRGDGGGVRRGKAPPRPLPLLRVPLDRGSQQRLRRGVRLAARAQPLLCSLQSTDPKNVRAHLDQVSVPMLRQLYDDSSVTYITLTGSAMVNWSRGFLIQGVTTVIVVSIRALGHCFGVSASIKGSRSPGHHKQIRSGWEVETLIYSDEGRYLHRRWSGSATSKPCTTSTYWRCSRCIDIHTGYSYNHTR